MATTEGEGVPPPVGAGLCAPALDVAAAVEADVLALGVVVVDAVAGAVAVGAVAGEPPHPLSPRAAPSASASARWGRDVAVHVGVGWAAGIVTSIGRS
ncbi:hypothetical protein GCM10025862_20900 [Arsenicicoccus piscis]|uniref:Uncharacterized protein n=1 Tax=Arsenicicoccus piscis TaxID=673954 RepID=A0ABQ6HQW3_9MICO|nr:hypothetical protein GCM10025862_20900 [Arsenicicoccus piscis]